MEFTIPEDIIPEEVYNDLVEVLSYGNIEDVIVVQFRINEYDFHNVNHDVWNEDLKPRIVEEFRKQINEKIGDKKYKIIDISKLRMMNEALNRYLSITFKIAYKK